MATQIPVRAWLMESDEVLATVMDVLEKRNAKAKKAARKRRGT
jgi:hypothetical protein